MIGDATNVKECKLKIETLLAEATPRKINVRDPNFPKQSVAQLQARVRLEGILFNSADVLVALVKAARPFAKLLQEHQAHIRRETPIFAINGAEITKGDLIDLNEALAALPAEWSEVKP